MALAFTRRFGAVNFSGPGDALVFRATTLHTWILRDVLLSNQSNSPQRIQLYIQSGSTYMLWSEPAIPGLSTVHLDLRQEILPDEELRVNGGSGSFMCVATGYAFDA